MDFPFSRKRLLFSGKSLVEFFWKREVAPFPGKKIAFLEKEWKSFSTLFSVGIN